MSKHVKVLADVGLVRRAVVGRAHRISLDATPLLDALEWVACYGANWSEGIDALEAYIAERRAGPDRSVDPDASTRDALRETDR